MTEINRAPLASRDHGAAVRIVRYPATPITLAAGAGRRREEAAHTAAQQFLRQLPRDACRAYERCLAAGVLSTADLAAADPATGNVPIHIAGMDGQLELLPFFAPGLILGRVVTASGRFTVMISVHRGVYHAFVGISGEELTGDFPTFTAAWTFALGEGLRTISRQ